jgi:drug/metabolite transporter (DMT)-like permease
MGRLASFLAVLFLSVGFYLLGEAFEHPPVAEAMGILAAALRMTLAAILLYFLLTPRRGQRPRTHSLQARGIAEK